MCCQVYILYQLPVFIFLLLFLSWHFILIHHGVFMWLMSPNVGPFSIFSYERINTRVSLVIGIIEMLHFQLTETLIHEK